MTIQEAIKNAVIVLKEANIETASLDASLLLSHCYGVDRATLLARGNDLIHIEKLITFHIYMDRRLNGECVAYITGKKEFWGLDFFVTPSVLVPRPETEVLVEATLTAIKGQGTRDKGQDNQHRIHILDLCTGSGAIAIALKHEIPELEVYAIDISEEALEIAKENAARLLPNNSNISFHHGDLYEALPHSSFSLITSNPPYIPTNEIKTLQPEVRNEPRLALDGGESGLGIITRIIDGAPKYLRRGGTLLLEADPRQMEKITWLLENKGFVDVQLYKDLAGHDRVIGGVFE